jgi:predicted nucleic acid-binding Zn ribbon protein
MDSFWAELFGGADPWARPVMGIALFTFVLYLFARPRKGEILTAEERQKQRRFAWTMFGLVAIFAILLYGFLKLTGSF